MRSAFPAAGRLARGRGEARARRPATLAAASGEKRQPSTALTGGGAGKNPPRTRCLQRSRADNLGAHGTRGRRASLKAAVARRADTVPGGAAAQREHGAAPHRLARVQRKQCAPGAPAARRPARRRRALGSRITRAVRRPGPGANEPRSRGSWQGEMRDTGICFDCPASLRSDTREC